MNLKNLRTEAIKALFKECEGEMEKIRRKYEGEEESLFKYLVSSHWNLNYGDKIDYTDYLELKEICEKLTAAEAQVQENKPPHPELSGEAIKEAIAC